VVCCTAIRKEPKAFDGDPQMNTTGATDRFAPQFLVIHKMFLFLSLTVLQLTNWLLIFAEPLLFKIFASEDKTRWY